ncbi:MAG: ATP-binding protein [Pseudomonadota bacterium]
MVALSTLFHRPQLARDMAQKILHVAVGSAAGSGLFLAAPRRTGKSTFMREDLRPALEQAGALVLYVDLWANPSADPGLVIVGAIRAELARHEGVVQRLAKAAGLDKVTVGGLAFDLDRIGLGNEVSLAGALAALSDESGRMIVLIIDEAQHAITTAAGVDALFALKAARDELNSSLHHGLRVVCTGSNRDKLAMLRNAKDQAFFGAPLVSFPTLQKDYIDWFCQHADLAFALDPDEVMELFRQASYRPEVIGAAADVFRFEFGVDPLDGPQRFAEEVARQAEAINQDMLRVVRSLTPIQSAVLRVMAVTGQDFAPFETATLERYRKALKQAGVKAADAKADVPGVQAALTALQDKKLVWKAARGVYAVEEHSLLVLLERDGLLDGL